MSKIQFWKQFTTVEDTFGNESSLYSICQRYNFESNLQQGRHRIKNTTSCIRYVKDTILKAIYNTCSLGPPASSAVFDMSKIQFWKQFTTGKNEYDSGGRLYSICQRYNFESNLQLIVIHRHGKTCCIRYVKDTILKAIYNDWANRCIYRYAVFDMSKIQFWKQFTTGRQTTCINARLYSICQRYNFESNLQRLLGIIFILIRCIRYVKDTILKAIYNKQRIVWLLSRLYSICQRYNFESNLQQFSRYIYR